MKDSFFTTLTSDAEFMVNSLQIPLIKGVRNKNLRSKVQDKSKEKDTFMYFLNQNMLLQNKH